MYDNPRHRKNNITKVRLNHYSNARLIAVAESLGIQPATLGRELVEMGLEFMGDSDIDSLAKKLKCTPAALIQQLVTHGAKELSAMLDEQSSKRLRA